MAEIADLDGTALIAGFRRGAFSPVEVARDALDRIARHAPALAAFVLVDEPGALARAAESEARWRAGTPRGPLDGLPVTIKDNLVWAGHPTRRGSRTTDAAPAGEDAPSVAALIAAGAVPLGKTTLPEFGWKGLGDSPLTGPTRNPFDTRLTTGGSSAGAAVAAALNLGVMHLGTDGAGSIRIPCAFTGVYGLKPSFGRVPAYPPSPFAIVSHVGPMARSVRDAAAMLAAIAAPDPRDITAMADPAAGLGGALEAGVRGLRIAWSPRLGHVCHLDSEVERLTAEAARVFEVLGAIVEEADPLIGDPVATLDALWRVGAWSVLRAVPEARWAEMDPDLVAEALRGRAIGGADYLAAVNARGALFTAMARFHARYDLILTPSVAVPAFAVEHLAPPGGPYGEGWLGWTPYSYPFNLTLQPAASLPCGLTAAGLPVGLQVVGPMGADARVLAASRAFEAARPWPTLSVPRLRH